MTETTTPRRQAVAERRTLLLDLRRSGASYAEAVAARPDLWPTEGHARKDAQRALRGIVLEAGREMVNLEAARLDRLQLALWPRAMDGDHHAAREITRIMERRARMLGLDKQADAFALAAEHDHASGILAGFMVAAKGAYAEMPDESGD